MRPKPRRLCPLRTASTIEWMSPASSIGCQAITAANASPSGHSPRERIRRTVKDAALAALARTPGRPGAVRNFELDAARVEIGQLTDAIKAQAIKLAIVRGQAGWG